MESGAKFQILIASLIDVFRVVEDLPISMSLPFVAALVTQNNPG